MKIAIIGGGFYGCYITKRINNEIKGSVHINIFDRESELMSRAGIHNQCRLHLGYHYPRSPETIRQTIEGFYYFKEDFADNIFFPHTNLYAIRKDGYVDFQQYLMAMDEFNLNYEMCDKFQIPYFKEIEKIDGVIKVGEGVIDLQKIRGSLLNSIEAKIFLDSIVEDINPKTGEIVVSGKVKGPYDYVINSTYVNPNIGLPKEMQFQLKYELAAMVLLKAPFGSDVALTIMDGNFVSLYPCNKNMATLSSVPYTPFLKCDSVEELEAKIKNAESIVQKNKVVAKILQHGKEMLNLDDVNLEVKGLWIAPKAKIRADTGDTRISAVKKHERLVSILCGKLDAVRKISDKVLEYIC